MNSYQINNKYGYQKSYDYLDDVINRTLKKLHVKNAIFSIIFIDDEEMQCLNNGYRNINRTTDVLSIALEDNKSNIKSECRILGDIFISIPKMINQSIEYDTGEERELSFLVIHGLLHLLGYDHIVKKDEDIMFKLQKEILDEKV